MVEKQITCKRCHRSQPESLGACDFCAEMERDAQDGREEIERDFKIAEENTERGRKMRERIDEMCYDYTHR